MHIKLVAIDLDGTLLHSDHKLSDFTKETLRELHKNGVFISIATGRSVSSIQKYINELGLDNVPCVGFNGATGVKLSPNQATVETIFLSSIPSLKTKELLHYASENNVVAQYYNGKTSEIFAVPLNDEHKDLMKRYSDLVGYAQTKLEDYETCVAETDPAKILLMTNQPDALIKDIEIKFGKEAFHTIRGSPHPFFVEFLEPGVDKGSALTKICQALDIDITNNVAAFGDGDNDCEMLRKVKYGVAMANARDVTKACANHVLDLTNNEDGVAKHLKEMQKNKMFDSD